MDRSKYRIFNVFKAIILIAKWLRRILYIVLTACMIGFANAYYDEYRWINSTRNFIKQEQVFNDEDKNE
jgi:hypothetical protein